MLQTVRIAKRRQQRQKTQTGLGGERGPLGSTTIERAPPLASSVTETPPDFSSPEGYDGDAPKPKPKPPPAPKDAPTDVTVLLVAAASGISEKYTGTASLASVVLSASRLRASAYVDAGDVRNLATNLNGVSGEVCVLVDVDSYGKDRSAVITGLTAALPLMPRPYLLIIQSKDTSIMSDLKQLKEHAALTSHNPIHANRVILMNKRRVIIVHDSGNNPADVWKRSGLDDGAYYELVGIDLGDIKADGAFGSAVAEITRECSAITPPPVMVIFQCAHVNLLLVALHATFLGLARDTRVMSLVNGLVNDASRLAGYAYNLYDATHTKIFGSGSTQLDRATHAPLRMAPNENSDVIVLGMLGPGKHDDQDGIYLANGAAHIVRDARAAHKDASGNPIIGGFNIHPKSDGFHSIRSNFLIYADLSHVTVKQIQAATSEITVPYRILVRPSGSNEKAVTIHGNEVETGKIIQMKPSDPLKAPQRHTAPVEAAPASVPSRAFAGPPREEQRLSHAPPAAQMPTVAEVQLIARQLVERERNVTTLVVLSDSNVYAQLKTQLDARYEKDDNTYKFTTFQEAAHMSDYTATAYALVFWFTGDKKEFVPIYEALGAIHRQTAEAKISLACTSRLTNDSLIPVPYHLYSEMNRTSADGVTTIEVMMLRAQDSYSSDDYKAIVVRPSEKVTNHDDPIMVVNMMVGKLQEKLKRPVALHLKVFGVTDIDGLKGAVGNAYGKCCVVLLDEDDDSLDILDKINLHGNGSLFVVSGKEGERPGRQDTKFSGWMRALDTSRLPEKNEELPVQNEILKGIHFNRMSDYAFDMDARNGPVAYVVTTKQKYETHQAFVDDYDPRGTLRKLICGGKTHALVYAYTAYDTIQLTRLTQKENAVLVIAACPAPLIDATSLIGLKCRVLINTVTNDGKTGNEAIIKQFQDAANYKEIKLHKGIAQKDGVQAAYTEFEFVPSAPTTNKFGMMSEFV
jgi:hypothetical protein